MVYWKSLMAQIRLYNLSRPNLYRADEKMFAGIILTILQTNHTITVKLSSTKTTVNVTVKLHCT